jgi:hypothetical protein
VSTSQSMALGCVMNGGQTAPGEVRYDFLEKFERTRAAWVWKTTNRRPYGRQVDMMDSRMNKFDG